MNGRIVGVAAILAVAAAAHADEAVPSATATTTPEPPRAQHGLAVGVEVGEPTSATVAWLAGKLEVAAAIGTGTRAGVGLSLHADAQLEIARIGPRMPLRIGVGARYYHHGYSAMSFDELPDSHVGVRVPVSLAYELGALQLYLELAPGVDVYRSASCSLASGPYSICPHAQERPLFVQLVIGARWFLSL